MIFSNSTCPSILEISWEDIREKVLNVNPKLAKIIDEISPDHTFPLYLTYYPYGTTIADSQGFYLPNYNGLTPKNALLNLKYAQNSLPMGVVLDKSMEYSIDLRYDHIAMPWLVCSPGSIFPFEKILIKNNPRTYAPNGILTLTSGARSVLMLPNIGDSSHHSILQRDYNVTSPAPRSLYDHWAIFKEIADCPAANCEWRACLLFFSSKWIDKINSEDKAWAPLKLYLHETAWNFFEYQRNYIYYEMTFSMIQKKRNLKPNPYLVDTARHLFSIALGAAPGYAPAFDETYLPLNLIQNAFIDSYGLQKYNPVIMSANHYDYENDKFPIYYSLKHPSTYVFSPKSRKLFSALIEMRELEWIIRVFSQELQRSNEFCSDTILHEIAKNIKFTYFHNEPDRHSIAKLSSDMPNFDTRFNGSEIENGIKESIFSCDAPFVRGCVSIGKKLN